MQLKFFCIPMYGDSQLESAVNQFVNSNKIVSVEREFVQDGQNSARAICVSVFCCAGAQLCPAIRLKLGQLGDK